MSPNFEAICKKAEVDREWKGNLSSAAKSLINGFLKVDPYKRLGAGDFSEVRGHEYFKGFDWN